MGFDLGSIATVFSALSSMEVIAMLLLGVVGGIFIGALPGLSATMGIALLIPITFGMNPIAALVLLAAIYTSAVYGGSLTAILIHTPGTPASAATALDGYKLTEKGHGLKALGIATICSMFGGFVSSIALLLLAPPLAEISLSFSAPEYFLIALFGLTIIASLSTGSMLKGFAAGLVGLLIGTIGVDVMSGFPRFTFGAASLESGISLIPAMIGLFSVSQVLILAEKGPNKTPTVVGELKGALFPRLDEWKRIWKIMIRGSFIGVIVGILPGAGGDVASWVSYNEAKRFSKKPEEFGEGSIEAVAASESANNAVSGGAMIPLLTLGIPGSAATAVMLGGLLIQGLQPGHELFTKNATIAYAVIFGFIIANVLMGIVGLVIARHVVKVASIPRSILAPSIIVLSVVGAYAINNNMFDVYVMIGFGFLGYIMRKANFPTAAVVLGLILGELAELGFRQALVMSKGDLPGYLMGRPISLVLVVLILVSLFSPLLVKWKKGKTRMSKI